MKIFNNISNLSDYFKQPILNDGIELEIIFGSSPNKNPVTKQIFMDILSKCKEVYLDNYVETLLDIRTEFRNNVSNVRCSIKGIDSIKNYCKSDSLQNINNENLEYIQKTIYSDGEKRFNQIKDEYYNIRLNLKKENPLSDKHHFVKSMLINYQDKRKYFRYKKRYSFITEDKLYRIDLTVVKETNKHKGKINFKKTFKEANILNNKEKYEIEIEYIGWKKEIGIPTIDLLFRKLNEDIYINDPINKSIGNIYDPLNLGINIPKESQFNENYTYDIHSPRPRHDDDINTQLISYNDSHIRYTYNDYNKLLGKFTKIKDSYFKENNIDPLFNEALKGYYRKGIQIGLIEDIFEEINQDTNEYLDTKVLISFTPVIGNIKDLIVPIDDLYNGYFTIKENSIIDGAIINNTLEPISDLFEVPTYKKNIPDTEKLSDKLIDILTNHVEFISKIIYNTDTLLSYKLKEEIIKKYKKLTEQNNWYFNLIGPQPVTLNLESIKLKSKHPLSINYAVTEKADGERYQLFITNNNGYLINSKQNVRDTGCHFLDISDDWILDGEYITKDKDNENINLFMIFDVYWCGKLTPQPIHTYPFLSNNPHDISRSSILNDFKKMLRNPDSIIRYDKLNSHLSTLDIDVKTYSYGYINNNSSINLSEITKNDTMKIFRESKKIIDTVKNGHYQYRTDGLIFLPTNLSVKGEIEGLQKKSIRGTWYQNFKWKPPEENTIDFLVKFKKDLIRCKLKDKIINQVSYSDNNQQIKTYKQVELYVGYQFERDPNINYCMLTLKGETSENKNLDKIKLFNSHSNEPNQYNTSNLELHNGLLLCINKDEIKDGDLVEMRFNKNSKTGTYWEPLRRRSDKIDPQDFSSANNIWDTINNPVTLDMITGKDNRIINQEIINIEKGKYYINKNDIEDKFLESYKLRQLHNYIKSRLIGSVCSSFQNNKIKIMDLSCGRGGDNGKYINNDYNTSFYLGIDISSNIHGACKRYYESNKRTKAVFIRGDTSKNIKSGECSEIENNDLKDKRHTEIITSIIYDTKKPIPKEYKLINDKFKGIANNGFDVVSSQFSLHYYFENETNFMGFINNLKENIKVGGYFIGTCYDGSKIFNHFKERRDKYKIWKNENKYDDDDDDNDDDDDDDDDDDNHDFNLFGMDQLYYKDTMGNVIFTLDATFTIEEFNYDPENIDNMFGVEIDVYMESIGQKIKEYLVNFDFFKDIMKKNGFEVSIPENMNPRYSQILRDDYFKNGLGQFKQVIENIDQLYQTDKDFHTFYKEAYKMKPIQYVPNPLQDLSSFNTYFIFKKIK